MKAEKDKFQLLVGELNEEKRRLEGKVIELEMQKSTAEEKEKLYQTQIAALKDQNNSLATSLKSDMERKVDIRPLRNHALMFRKKIHQMQLQMAEETLKIQQMDSRLEEFIGSITKDYHGA